jgi:hypothetical protein
MLHTLPFIRNIGNNQHDIRRHNPEGDTQKQQKQQRVTIQHSVAQSEGAVSYRACTLVSSKSNKMQQLY